METTKQPDGPSPEAVAEHDMKSDVATEKAFLEALNRIADNLGRIAKQLEEPSGDTVLSCLITIADHLEHPLAGPHH
jgi:hypothetical protein